MVKIAIVTYSLFGHIDSLARALKKGIESAGGTADIYRVEETLSDEILGKVGAPEKPADIPVATPETLLEYDAYLFGIPSRFGALPAQWAAFWDKTAALWTKGSLNGKVAGLFVSSAAFGGGQESVLKNAMNYLVHHGIIYIPLGYKNAFAELANIDEPHGGSPWGAGTMAASDLTRNPSDLELRIAQIQGKTFYEVAAKFVSAPSKTENKTTEKTPIKKVDAPKRQAEPVVEKKEPETKNNCCVVM